MLFNFKLRPIQDVAPWGREGNHSLSWFGLTDGWYWIDCDGHELFRRAGSIDQLLKHQGFQLSDAPYTDYQVVRLWEDILEILPDVLSPIPTELLRKIRPGLTANFWHQQIAESIFTDGREIPNSEKAKYESATDWLGLRRLDSLYLTQGPRIWLWSDSSQVFIHWNNTGLMMDGNELWTAQSGTYSLSRECFIEEVRSFDRRLITAMDERVQEIQQRWERPQIRIDKNALLSEQNQRSQWLSQAFERLKNTPQLDWQEVADAIAHFEKLGYLIRR